ncbi:hypothetical protein DFH09DRAFT_424735 [Mycena vulgaris]|nr:hypothetical protein DFH09DRAFT_424735 [Mycena vulgaris]
MTSTCTPPDFNTVLKGLSTSVQDLMTSWHAVQTASLRTSSQPLLLRTWIAPLTRCLQTHWAGILPYLQKCHEFGADAILWQTALEEGPDLGASSVLEELTSASNELCHESEILIQHSDSCMECLSSLVPQLSDVLRGSSRYVKTSPAEKGHHYLVTAPKTTAFLGAGQLPDGPAVITATHTGLTEIRNSLYMLRQFWVVASETCDWLMKSNTSTLLEHSKQLGKIWKEYQEEIVRAKVSITKSLDAVVIEPDVPSAFRRQPRRRGSSKSENSILASRESPPRRMSELDDDEVPKCWGFNFGERKRR